jgi:hypothetical protein
MTIGAEHHTLCDLGNDLMPRSPEASARQAEGLLRGIDVMKVE